MTHTYKNSPIERGVQPGSPFVPASEDPGITGVATRDVVIDRETGVAARLFLPTGAVATGRRLPLFLFFHGGGRSHLLAAEESAFSDTYHRYATSLAARAMALVVSVEYRVGPEHPMTAAYDDAWTALRWAASSGDPWLLYHADRRCAFVAGDGAGGGSIAYRTAVRASRTGEDIGVKGVVLVHPHLWEPEWLHSEKAGHDGASLMPRPSVAQKRVVRQRERRFVVSMSGSGRGGKVTLVDLHSQEHGLHLYRTVTGGSSAEKLMDSIVEVVNKEGPMLRDKNGVSSGVMDRAEDIAPTLSNRPCNKAVTTVEVLRRAVTKSCL
ncbi:hypothetical protein HU200_002922 [Digitaria exilis]|uniref:Alpha/beta hydrolase fold-3 domain-containing protein n=1 Tax=Digitaria exilis TaxID=1010633 RepID=A0A835FUW7_9POAL|nr:hypothetical protein HU200_002922 [Digitaria exilis]CAB3467962.1 unnamed protein product [Digitaria exilis]